MRARWLLLVTLALGGCLEADLGEVPLFCNPGQPACPRGYTCVAHQGAELCVKEGHPLDARASDGARRSSSDARAN